MGGNALKNIKIRKYNRKEYFDLFEIIKDRLYEYSLKYNVWDDTFVLIPSYKNKETFGDMDILINEKWFGPINYNLIFALYKPTEVFIEKNSNVLSFDFRELQIDFIFMPDKYFKSALTYYSYNDLGNLMGRIANKMGTRYGHDGLKKLISSGKSFKEINLSDDISKIFEFLGFDYNEFLKGFNDLEDIFKYVINSKFFNKELFFYENLNHENRTRNRKRKTYQKFLDFINNLKDNNIYEYNDKYFSQRINEFFFNHLNVAQKELDNEEERRKLISQKFNGNIINDITGLESKELGEFINLFKASKTFDQYILNTNQENIFIEILDFYKNKYKKVL